MRITASHYSPAMSMRITASHYSPEVSIRITASHYSLRDWLWVYTVRVFDVTIFYEHNQQQVLAYFSYIYRKVSNIRRTLVGNKIVDHSDVVGASPVGAAPTTSSLST